MLSNQCKRIIDFVNRYGTINPMQALNYCGVMRLAARINDLEKAGYQFKHEPVNDKNRYGEKVRYMRYRKV
jgi:hypothetical protein